MTLRQTKAIKELVENGGNVSKAMISAGYSQNTAKTPQKLTGSKGFNKALEPYLKAHHVTLEQYLLNIGLAMTADKQNQFTGEITPDIGARLAGNRQAERFIGLPGSQQETVEAIKNLSETSDEVEMYKLVFKNNKE